MRNGLDPRRLTVPLVAALLSLSCSEQKVLTDPEGTQPIEGRPVRNVVAALECTANVAAEQLSCGAPERLRGVLDPRFLIVGGQGLYVNLISANVDYSGATFSADVQVENLLPQVMGTPDGAALTGVNVFFHSGPSVTGGSGTVTVSNEDGTGNFTGTDQPYHHYDEILSTPPFAPDNLSEVKNWQWHVPSTVETFVFEVFVQADVPGESGYVEMSPTKAILSPTQTTTIDASVHDAVGRLVAGTVTFSSGDPSIATVDPSSGLVTAVSGGRVEITASTGGPEADGVAVITVDAVGYQIEVVFLSSVSSTQRAAFENAAARWGDIITSDIGAVTVSTDRLPDCGGAPIDEFVDDIVIRANVGPIDGVGGILGQAGPCFVRVPGLLPAYGVMIFDSADLANIEANGQLGDVILHEMGHVIGIGTLWQLLELLRDTGDVPANCTSQISLDDPYFDGPDAVTAFDAAGGTSYTGNKVPAEDSGGLGTRCGHWRESVFDDELMTGIVESPGTPMPLSAITIGSLADIGYSVDPAPADPYTLPGSGALAAATAGDVPLIDDIWLGPVFTVDESGRMVQILPDRRPDWQRRLDADRGR